MEAMVNSCVHRPKSAIGVGVFVTLLLVALAASAKMWLITNAFLEDADAWLYMSVGNEIAQGAVLFQDVWCDKPAGIFYFYALLIKLGLKPRRGVK